MEGKAKVEPKKFRESRTTPHIFVCYIISAVLIMASAFLYFGFTPLPGIRQLPFFLIVDASILGLGFLLFLSVEIKRFLVAYEINDKVAVKTHGIIRKGSESIHLIRVNDITVSQGIIGRIINVGNVSIETDTSKIVFCNIGGPGRIKNDIVGFINGNLGSADLYVQTLRVPRGVGHF